jgi:hypothetical protein
LRRSGLAVFAAETRSESPGSNSGKYAATASTTVPGNLVSDAELNQGVQHPAAERTARSSIEPTIQSLPHSSCRSQR